MSDVLGWGTIVLVLSVPLLFVLASVSTHDRGAGGLLTSTAPGGRSHD